MFATDYSDIVDKNKVESFIDIRVDTYELIDNM